MKKKLLERRAYISPMCKVLVVETCNQLLSTSFPNCGGHNDGNDDGQDLSAKQGFFDENEEEETPHWGI